MILSEIDEKVEKNIHNLKKRSIKVFWLIEIILYAKATKYKNLTNIQMAKNLEKQR